MEAGRVDRADVGGRDVHQAPREVHLVRDGQPVADIVPAAWTTADSAGDIEPGSGELDDSELAPSELAALEARVATRPAADTGAGRTHAQLFGAPTLAHYRAVRPSWRDVAGRSVRAPSPPRRGRLLSAPGPSPTLPAAVGGKVLDVSALMAWVHGSLAMATWVEIAFGLGLTLLTPAHALDEVLLARPERADLIEVLFSRPSVVILERPDADQLDLIGDRFTRDGAFDPLAPWVAALCRERGWSR